MEDIKNVLEQNKAYITSSSDESYSDSEIISVWDLENTKNDSFVNKKVIDIDVKCCASITSKKRNGEIRMPTRRPDPNVYNRNALLARENRRKKKIYLETIEKELQFARKTNRALVKALKRQVKIAQRFEKEKKYFQSLVTNRLDMLTLVHSSNSHHIPETEISPFPADDYVNNNIRDRRNTGSLDSSPYEADSLSIEFDSPSDGTVTDPIESLLRDLLPSDFSTSHDFFTDFDNGSDTSLPTTFTTWDDVLWGDRGCNIDNDISTNLKILQNNDIQSFNNDHCYVSSPTFSSIETPEQKSESSDYIDVEGGCTDIGEYSPNSNWNHAYLTPPLQLLSEES